MTFNYLEFCNNVKKLREQKGYNKYQMSIQSDINYPYYCEIENGNSLPNFKAVISIANALDINLSNLLGYEFTTKDDVLKNSILSKINAISDENVLNKLYKFTIMLKTRPRTDVNDD